jgi:hypothetical protein
MGRTSSRLRGEDLDRRIVNNDPERLLRQIREQKRLKSEKVLIHLLDLPFAAFLRPTGTQSFCLIDESKLIIIGR